MMLFLLLAHMFLSPVIHRQITAVVLLPGSVQPATTEQTLLPADPVISDSNQRPTQLQHMREHPDVPELPDEQAFENDQAYEQALAEWAELFPLDLNRATRHELLLLPDLSPAHADAILAWRTSNRFEHTSDLVSVAGLPDEVRQQILPWVTVSSAGKIGSMREAPIQLDHLARIQLQHPLVDGYRGNDLTLPHYTGSPLRMVQRHRVHKGPLSLAVSRVKHPGEPAGLPWYTGSIAGNLQWYDEQKRFRIIAGDYTLRFGQGHALWSTPVMGKGSAPHRGPWRNAPGLSAYHAGSRTGFLRGVALQMPLPVKSVLPDAPRPQWTLFLFASRLPRSATELEDSIIRPPSAHPLYRTRSEVSRRHNSVEYLVGVHLRRHHERLISGITWYTYRMNKPVVPASNQPTLKNAPHQVVSVDVHLPLGSIELFGEGALLLQARPYQKSGMDAWNQTFSASSGVLPRSATTSGTMGMAGSFDGIFDWVLALRALGPGYWSEYGNAFRHGAGAATNQKGLYAGLRLRLAQSVRLGAYIDRFLPADPSGRYEGLAPGWDAMAQLRVGLSRTVQLQVRIRHVQQNQSQAVWPHAGFSADELSEAYTSDTPMSVVQTIPHDRTGLELTGLASHLNTRSIRRTLNANLQWNPVRTLRSATYLYLVKNSDGQKTYTQNIIEPNTNQQNLNNQIVNGQNSINQNENTPNRTGPMIPATGTALRQSLRWLVLPKLRMDVNMVLFDTDSYESRLYVFEQAMSQTMASRMLYGRGRQSGMAVRWEPVQGLLLEASYSLVYQYDRTSSGSGHDFSKGAARRYMGAQLRYRY